MDIYYKRNGQCFNLRVAAIIKKDEKILLKKDFEDYYTLPGGRVRFGETTERAIKRIIFEQFNRSISINRLISINENFFTYSEDDYHEVLFIYLCDLKNDDGDLEVENDPINLHAVSVNDLLQINLQPRFLIEELKRLPLTISHTVNQ